MTISDVQFTNGRYTVYDESGNETKTFWDSEGELLGFGLDFLIFMRNEQYRFLDVESGNEITNAWASSVGQFKHANGNLVVFENNNRVVAHKVGYSGLSEVSSRWV